MTIELYLVKSIIFGVDFEKSFWEFAYRAEIGRVCADHDMTAVPTYTYGDDSVCETTIVFAEVDEAYNFPSLPKESKFQFVFCQSL